MFSANAMWARTGYGVQAHHLLPRLQALGHEVAQFAWYGLHAGMMKVGDIPIYPAVHAPFGTDIVGAHVKHFRADLMISLQDIWPLPEDYRERFDCAWAPWFPIDHEPVPPQVLERALTAEYPIVYSLFGAAEMKEAGHPCWYIPHGVDTETFCSGDKQAAREKLKLPADAYIVDIVAANKGYPSRKALAENIEAFAQFRKKHTEAFLYLHTDPTTKDGGIDLLRFLRAVDVPESAYRLAPRYSYLTGALGEDYMAAIYQASDCHLSASTSEGFGIPILEAQACGCPVVTTNFSSMPELTWAGIAVEPYQRTWTPLESWVAAVPVAGVAEALEEIYLWSEERRRSKCAFGLAMARHYDWDQLVKDYWRPFLRQVEQDLDLEPAAPRPEAVEPPEVAE